MEVDPGSVKEKPSGDIIQRKPKTELRKPKKSKKVEEVDPIILRKRMRQLYKAVVNYQVWYEILVRVVLILCPDSLNSF